MDESKFSHAEDEFSQEGPSKQPLLRKPVARLQGLVRKLIGKANLTKVPRKWWLVTALVALAASSGLTMWQQHGPARLHEPLSEWKWFWHPLEMNYSAALPQINRQLQTVALQPGTDRVWIAGEAGFVAFTRDSDGLSWSPLDYNPSTGEFHVSEGKKQPLQGNATSSRIWRAAIRFYPDSAGVRRDKEPAGLFFVNRSPFLYPPRRRADGRNREPRPGHDRSETQPHR